MMAVFGPMFRISGRWTPVISSTRTQQAPVARWCSTAELDVAAEQADMKAALQGKLGGSRFQVRIQFRPPLTNNDGVGDVIRLGDVKLVVTYTTP